MEYIEMLWDCPACGTSEISALVRMTCPNCGHSIPDQSQWYAGNRISDPEKLALARGDPYWVCSSCGRVNLATSPRCVGCQNPREESDAPYDVRDLGHYLPRKSSDGSSEHPSTSSGTVTPDVSSKPKTASQSSKASPPLVYYNPDVFSVETRTKVRDVLRVSAVLIVLLLLGFFLFHTRKVDTRVSRYHWSRRIDIEVYAQVHEEGWSLPAGAYNVDSESRVREYREITETRTRTRTIHHPQTCYRDLGNGAVEEYDCGHDSTETEEYQVVVGEEPIYDTWYSYDIDKWVYQRSVEAAGDDQAPYWPTYVLADEGHQRLGAERVGRRSESYEVFLETVETNSKGEHDIFTYHATLDEFLRFKTGEIYTIQVNHFGWVTNVPLEK